MLILNCPSCKRPLTLGDNLRGSWVMCPACKTTFQATGAAPAPVPPMAAPPPPPPQDFRATTPYLPPGPPAPANPALAPSPAPFAPTPPASTVPPLFPTDPPIAKPVVPANVDPTAFAFESEEVSLQRLRVQAQVGSAAGWMGLTVFMNFIMGLVCMIYPSPIAGSGQGTYVVVLVVTFLLVYGPLVLVALGTTALYRQSSYLLTIIGAGMAILLGVMMLIAALALLLTLFRSLATENQAGMAFICLVLAPIASTGSISGFMGGVKTILILQKPEVLAVFR